MFESSSARAAKVRKKIIIFTIIVSVLPLGLITAISLNGLQNYHSFVMYEHEQIVRQALGLTGAEQTDDAPALNEDFSQKLSAYIQHLRLVLFAAGLMAVIMSTLVGVFLARAVGVALEEGSGRDDQPFYRPEA